MELCKYYKINNTCSSRKYAPKCECYGDPTECELPEPVGYEITPACHFKKALLISLKELIKDFVRVILIDDYIRIEIYYNGEYNYCYVVRNIDTAIENGEITPEELAHRIRDTYKTVIISRHFNN